MHSTCTRRAILESLRTLWRGNRLNESAPAPTLTTMNSFSTFPSSSFASSPSPSPSSSASSSSSPAAATPLAALTRVLNERYSCRRFDPARPVPLELVEELLTVTLRSPTAFNLQPWTAVVVHEAEQRRALAHAVLSQSQPLTAPVTVVFAGNVEPERNAPAVLEMSMDCGYTNPMFGPQFLRYVYYETHAGPLSSMSFAKSVISSWYSNWTGNAMLSVPTTMLGYAWKQTMIPAITFLYLAEAAGLRTSMLEGLDEEQVRKVTGLPENFTVPVVVCLGYPEKEVKDAVRSPRFPPQHMIRWGKY